MKLERPSPPVITQARHLLRSTGNLPRLNGLFPHLHLPPAQATTLRANSKLATRLTRHRLQRYIHFHHPESVIAYLPLPYRTADQDILGDPYLDTRIVPLGN